MPKPGSVCQQSGGRCRERGLGMLKKAAVLLIVVVVLIVGAYLVWPWERMYFNGCEKRDRAGLTFALRFRPGLMNKDIGGRTPLGRAAEEGYEEGVLLLLKHGADPNALDRGGYSPLHCAAYAGEAGIARLLLEAGADPNLVSPRDQTLYVSLRGQTPLHRAAHYGHTECVRVLLAGGAERNIRDEKGETAKDLAGQAGHLDIVDLLE